MHMFTGVQPLPPPSFGMAGYRYEWDEAKRSATVEKRGIDFLAVFRFDWTSAIIVPDARRDYGEARLVAYGRIDGRLYSVVFTESGTVRRIISMRKANRREQAAYSHRTR